MVATGRLKEARRIIADLEQQVNDLTIRNEELTLQTAIHRADYETVNEKLQELHRFVKEVSEGRSKHNKEAQGLLMD